MKNFYIQLNKSIEQNKILYYFTHFTNYLTYLVEVIYIGTIIYLFYHATLLMHLSLIIKPILSLVFVYIIRRFYDSPRPFERYHFKPIIEHTCGHSFPSKHATSAMIIALMFQSIELRLFYFMLLLSFFVGLSRILQGVHHIKDILAGYLLALMIYII